eukprot:5551881-Pyramimonas_sp.AAC.1
MGMEAPRKRPEPEGRPLTTMRATHGSTSTSDDASTRASCKSNPDRASAPTTDRESRRTYLAGSGTQAQALRANRRGGASGRLRRG